MCVWIFEGLVLWRSSQQALLRPEQKRNYYNIVKAA
jgi:hypothetical protein